MNQVALSVALAASVCLAVRAARADQIVLVDDGHGHKVYINTGDPVYSRRGHALRPQSPPPEIDKLVERTAEQHRVDPQLVKAIIQVESGYDARAVSSKGALGLMQLIPATARRFGVSNAFNPKENIEGGVNYLRYLLDTFNGDVTLSLAAYNAGEHSVMREGGVPHYSETQDYVEKVRSLYDPGADPLRPGTGGKKTPSVTVYRFVDSHGVVHFTDGSDL